MIDETGKNSDSGKSADDKFTAYLHAEMDAQHKADQDARNEPNLRQEMIGVVEALGIMLDDHAANLAWATDGKADAFETDITRDLLTWQLTEFLIRGYLDRNPVEPAITRGWQVTEAHARAFFAVDLLGDGSLVADEKANRS